jgi:hypothetical protein
VTMLEDRLRALVDALDLDTDDALADAVLARLDESPSTGHRPLLRIAAALALVLALMVAAVPSSRRAVADWFGFEGVRIERRPDAPTVSDPDPIDTIDPVTTAGTVVDVDGTAILVSEFVGTLDNPAIAKTVGDGTEVIPVTVRGAFGLWIDGDPHDVLLLDDGDIVYERFAGNTLLWQDGRVIRRVEGFGDLADAIEFAESFGT